MSHRFRALEDLDAELVRVTAEQGAQQSKAGFQRRLLGGLRSRRLAAALPAVGVVLVASTIALAATGVILTGSSVPPTASQNPYVGAGLPLPGQSKLLPLQVPDPYGGLPWGMRVVHTTRGLVCVQIGRIQNGTLGELGIDGVYHDDGRFHPVGPGVLPAYAGGATEGGVTSERGSCVLADGDVTGNGEAWGSAVAAEFTSVSENAAFAQSPFAQSRKPSKPGPPQTLRNIAYGILGPHAISVSYREGSETHTERVVPGVGAYLIVQRAKPGSTEQGQGSAPGTDTPGEGPGTSGVLTVIRYEHNGKTCENGYNAANGQTVKIQHPCPTPNPYPPSLRVTPPGSFVRHPSVKLKIHNRTVTAAEVTFAAPFPVTSAAESYTVRIEPCPGGQEGGGLATLDHNVAKGAIVHLTLPNPFPAHCAHQSITAQVIYDSSGPDAKRSYGMTPGELLIGSATIRLPRGDHAAPRPHHARR